MNSIYAIIALIKSISNILLTSFYAKTLIHEDRIIPYCVIQYHIIDKPCLNECAVSALLHNLLYIMSCLQHHEASKRSVDCYLAAHPLIFITQETVHSFKKIYMLPLNTIMRFSLIPAT